jgi:hypothetical protein
MRKVLFASLILSLLLPVQAQALKGGEQPSSAFEENRTNNRSPSGILFFPNWLIAKPEHYEFLPQRSNHDPQNTMAPQWDGQEWDTAAWDGVNWTPEKAIERFYVNKTFKRQYMSSRDLPVLVVGPTFYKLSDLDRRRSVKLLVDHEKVFDSGIGAVELRDWDTNEIIGNYTKKGLLLN